MGTLASGTTPCALYGDTTSLQVHVVRIGMIQSVRISRKKTATEPLRTHLIQSDRIFPQDNPLSSRLLLLLLLLIVYVLGGRPYAPKRRLVARQGERSRLDGGTVDARRRLCTKRRKVRDDLAGRRRRLKAARERRSHVCRARGERRRVAI